MKLFDLPGFIDVNTRKMYQTMPKKHNEKATEQYLGGMTYLVAPPTLCSVPQDNYGGK